MTKPKKDLGASVQARLRNLAKQRGDDVQLVLTQFVLERLLHRLSMSPCRRDFVLKGAMLFAVWTKIPHRATHDIDLLGRGSPELARLAEVFRGVCRIEVAQDGVLFDADSVQAGRIREDQMYEGVRVTLAARLGSARVGVQIDIGFGDAVHPEPAEITFPSLLDLPESRLFAYPRETVVAEKFHAMATLGLLNSRMKDFYDLFVLESGFAFDGPTLAEAIRGTFARRQSVLTATMPVALQDEFANSPDKKVQWSAFLRRNRLGDGGLTLGAVVMGLRGFPWSVVRGILGEQPLPASWPAGGPWMANA